MTLPNLAEHKRMEELYRTVVELAPDSIITVDMEGVITSSNSAATRMLGYSKDELIGKHFSKIGVVRAGEIPQYLELFKSALREEVTQPLELTFYPKDGTSFLAEVRVGVLKEGGKTIGLQALSREITERKRVEEDAQKRLRGLTALREVSEVINSTLDLKEVFQRVVDELSNTFGYRLVDIYLLKGETLRLQASVGYDAQTTIELIPLERGVVGRVARTGQLAFVRDVSQDPDYIPSYPDIASEICVPIMSGEELLGTLNVEADEKRPLTDDDLQLLSTLSSHIGVAIENARLYEAVKSERDKLAVIMAGMEDGLDVVSKDYIVRFQNRVLTERFGDLTGQLCYKGYMGLEEPCEFCPMVKAIEKGEPHRAHLVGKDGRDYELISMPLQNPDGTVDAVEIVRDITERKRAEKALRESEEKFKAQYKGIPVPTYTWQRVEEDFVLVGYNDAAEVITHGNVVNFVGRTASGMYRDRPDIIEELSRCFTGQTTIKGEMEYRFEITGESKHLAVTYGFVPPDLVMVHTEDITERKQAEEEITHRTNQLALINEVGQRVAPILELNELYQTVVEAVQEKFGYQYVSIFSLQDDEVAVEAVAGPNLELIPSGYTQKVGEGMIGWVAQSGKALVANDVAKEPRFLSLEFLDIAAEVDVPIRLGGKTIGVLAVASDRPNVFFETDITALQTIADQVARVIENARLYGDERRKATQLAVINQVGRKAISILDLDEMLKEVARSIRSGFDYYNVALFLVDKERQEAVIEAVVGGFEHIVPGEYRQSLDQGIIGWVIRTGRPWLANDVSQDPYYIKGFLEEVLTKSELCVPIQLGGEVIGALDIQSIHLDAFDETDVMAMETLSGQIAIAIQNIRLYEAMKRRVTELSILQEAAMAAARLSDFREVLRVIVEELRGTLDFANVQAWLLDEKAQQLVATASVGYPVPATIKPKLGEGITGWVAIHRQPQNVPDVSKDPRYICGDERVRSELAVPLEVGDRLIGVLNIEHYELNAFSEHDMRLLSALAGQISVAIESARLRDEERKRSEELSALLDTAQTLASSLDLAQLLETIASQAKGLTQADGSRIYLLEPDEETLKALVVLERYAEEIMATPVPLGQGITGHVAATGIAEMVNHAERDPRAMQIPGTPQEAQCLMCVPLTVKGKAIGVMTLSREGEKEFEDSDLRLLTSLASQAATTIENARLYEETKRLAATDPLTGVWNRRHIEDRLRTEAARARRFYHPLSVLVMDIDNLKLFNDTYGHAAGDKVIRTVAQAVLTSCREIDLVGRYGGDEFAVILPEADARGATMVAERILATLAKEPFQTPEEIKVPINMSIGAASYPSDSDDADRLFSLADAAMYRVKVAGGGQFASLMVGPEEVPEALVAPFNVLQGLLIAVDAKDRYTFKHSQQVTERALALARAVGLSEEEMRALEVAGKLHDVGKIGIPANVLRKPGVLTPEEWKTIQEHPRLGYMVLQQLPQMETMLEAVLHHHERWDGNGYPDGLKGKQIPKLARILAIADAYSAMLADRPYRKALSQQEALRQIENCAGTQFDPELVELFADLPLSVQEDKRANAR